MKIIKINDKSYNSCFTKIEWSGAIDGSSRVLKVEYDIEDLSVDVGDSVKFELEDTEIIFSGKIFSLEKAGEKATASFIAFDNSIYLNKNKFMKNFYNRTPSSIVKEICGELNLKVDKLPIDGVLCSFPALDKSGYEIILIAYTIQHNKDKKIYSIVCNDSSIEVVEQGVMLDKVELNSLFDIRRSFYSKTIENMVNQIVVYKTEKEKQQIIDKQSNESDKKKYGLFQNIVEYTKDMNNIFNAREMLKGVEKTGKIMVNGNVDLQSGYTVAVKENKSGLVGNYLIISDTHVWEKGDYYTEIVLDFENKMNEINFEKYEKKATKKKKIKEKKWSLTEGEND